MIAIKDGAENVTQTVGRTQTKGSHFTTGKIIIVCTGTIISVALTIVILREFYKYRRIIRPIQGNSTINVIYSNVA